jgi:transcriptional regulator with XRE-family HTH domain
MKDELTQLIEEIKKAENLTQREVAERLGYEHTYLSQVLNGKKEVSKKFLEKVKLTFPTARPTIDALNQVQKELTFLPEHKKIDKILHIIQEHSGELKGLNHKLREIEQKVLIASEFQAEYQEYLVSKLDKDSDPESTVADLQQSAFDKMARRRLKDTHQPSRSSHR